MDKKVTWVSQRKRYPERYAKPTEVHYPEAFYNEE